MIVLRRRRLLSLAAVLACASGLSLSAAAATVVVTPTTPTWSIVQETPSGSGAFVTGPATPPLGSGSLQFTVGPAAGGVLARTAQHAGTPLASISALGFSYYVSSAPTTGIGPSIQIEIDYDGTDATEAWQGRLVFDPGSYGQPVPQGTWVTVNAKTEAGGWFSTGTPIVGNAAQPKLCGQGSPATCTWTQVLQNYPNAVIRPVIGAFGVKLGNFGGAGVAAVDKLVIGDTTYDFEASTPPTASNCGGFTDVVATDSYCSSVEWMKNRAVTVGCGDGTTYCPNDNVSRAQMAIFMTRLGKTLSPVPTLTQQVTGPLAPAPYWIVCESGDAATADHAQTSINQWTFNGSVSALSTVYPVLSPDGGTTWFVYGPGLVVDAGGFRAVSGVANADLGASETVRFALGVIGPSGGTVAGSQCVHNAVLVNRNPADSPLDQRALRPLTEFVRR
jgi:hypothetical protein